MNPYKRDFEANIVTLEKIVFGKRVLLIEKGTFICLKKFFENEGTLNRELLDFSKRVLLIENREYHH